jgi:hypothetical protein
MRRGTTDSFYDCHIHANIAPIATPNASVKIMNSFSKKVVVVLGELLVSSLEVERQLRNSLSVPIQTFFKSINSEANILSCKEQNKEKE